MAKKKSKRRVRSAWEKRVVEAGEFFGNPDDPRYILYLAIGYDELKEAIRLIDYGVDINDTYDGEKDSDSLFQGAARNGNVKLLKYMIKHRGDPNQVGPEGTALEYAARAGQHAAYDYLRPLTNKKHYPLAIRYLEDGNRSRPEKDAIFNLWHACLIRKLPTVKKLLGQGLDVNASSLGTRGHSPLHAACQNGHLDIVKMLLDLDSDPNAESYDGLTPLDLVATEVVCKAMLEAGAIVNHRSLLGGTPLMSAINLKVFQRLVKAGADLTAVDNLGRGVLLNIITTVNCQKGILPQKLLKVDVAFDKQFATICRKLVKAGNSVNDQHPGDGITPLMLTAILHLPETCSVLLKADADVAATDSEGKTALGYSKPRSPVQKVLRGTMNEGC